MCSPSGCDQQKCIKYQHHLYSRLKYQQHLYSRLTLSKVIRKLCWITVQVQIQNPTITEPTRPIPTRTCLKQADPTRADHTELTQLGLPLTGLEGHICPFPAKDGTGRTYMSYNCDIIVALLWRHLEHHTLCGIT